MTSLTFLVNKTSTDDTLENHPENFEAVANDDVLIFTAGSDVVADGQPIPSDTDLNRAASMPNPSVPVIVAHYILADISTNLLKEIFLAGKQNKQYIFCASFDGPTASEPVLEAWDTADMLTINSFVLGSGLPNNSWLHAICTTTNPAGINWIGVKLAGNGTDNNVLLNNGSGPLSIPGTGETNDLYFDFYVQIPAGLNSPGVANPILAIVYTTN